ncbi:MAG: S8 family serine peptidase [Thermoleophilia bacterium]
MSRLSPLTTRSEYHAALAAGSVAPLLLLCLLVLFPAVPAESAPSPRFLARPVPAVASLGVVDALADLGVRKSRSFPQLGIWALEGGPAGAVSPVGLDARDASALLRFLRRSGRFEWVVPVETRTFSYLPDDEFWAQQWGPRMVGLPEAWDTVTGDEGVTVAVIDTGLNPGIADFAGRVVHPYSALTDDQDPASWLDIAGHGTSAAAVAAATGDDGLGIAGAAWHVGLMPVKVGDGSGLSVEDELAGVVWAVEHGAAVLNLSFGSTWESTPEELVVRWALDRGAVMVAAAGNGGTEYGVEYPAGYAGVVSVGSVSRNEKWSIFSPTGAAVDLVAPGEEVLTWTLRAHDWYLSPRRGTSFAAPLVAGVAALMVSVNPALGPADVEYILTRTADDRGPAGRDDMYGWGLLDAAEAVATAAAWRPVAFSDVPAYHPYALAVAPLAAAGVVSGFSDGAFGPEEHVTRQQFAKMVLLALGSAPTEDMVSPFADVERSATGLYLDHYVALAAQLGITTGTSLDPPLFDPYGSVTRAQVVTMAVRALDATMPAGLRRPPAPYRPPFGSFSPVHDEAAVRAGWNGMLDGLEGMGEDYDMWAPATRGEVASVLAWALERRTGLR